MNELYDDKKNENEKTSTYLYIPVSSYSDSTFKVMGNLREKGTGKQGQGEDEKE